MPRPTESRRKFVGIIGSGQIGLTPFDRQSWSGSSRFFFRECERQGLLSRAFGVEVPRLKRYAFMALNYSPNGRRWRTRYYMDPRYREALTKIVRTRLLPDDFDHSFLQIGAMYDVPGLVNGRCPCFSYHDGNMAQSLRSPYAVKGLNAESVRRGLEFEKRVYRGLTRIFTMSEYLRQSFIDDFDVPPARVQCVGAGVNLERLPERPQDKMFDTKAVLFIGVDFARKGGWQLLRAFKTVRKRHPDARLHIVGPRELAIPAELSDGVEHHGFLRKTDATDRSRLEELFRRCSLFVMPSLYEPFGIAPLEAMAHQLPCVVTNGWALREIVTPGCNGELVDVGDEDSLASTIIGLLSSPDTLGRLGENGRQRVVADYTWEKVVTRLKAGIAEAAALFPS
jgi:glycosyltransferase involved in cell wall biosynthesis